MARLGQTAEIPNYPLGQQARILGQGSFATVISAQHSTEGGFRALKYYNLNNDAERKTDGFRNE